MAIGSKWKTNSFVILTNGKKMHLSNSVANLKKQLSKKRESIVVKSAGLFPKEHTLLKTAIESYGKVYTKRRKKYED